MEMENWLGCASPSNFPRSRLPSLALTGWFLDVSLGAVLIVNWQRRAHSVVDGSSPGQVILACIRNLTTNGSAHELTSKPCPPWFVLQVPALTPSVTTQELWADANTPTPLKLLFVRCLTRVTDIKLEHPILNQGSYRGLRQRNGRCSHLSQVLVSVNLLPVRHRMLKPMFRDPPPSPWITSHVKDRQRTQKIPIVYRAAM